MNRRQFILRTSLVAAGGLFARGSSLAQSTAPAAPAEGFRSLRRNTGYFTARGGTIGWLASADALAAIDAQFPDTARAFVDGLPGRDGRRLDVLVNTHHHADHTAGNAVIAAVAARHVAHENVPALQRARAEDQGKLEEQVYASELFADTKRIELGDEALALRYFGPAHTKGDIVSYFEKANVVHTGDLVFNRVYPVIDRPGGANVGNWIKVLEQMAATYPKDAVYVFGHGGEAFGVEGKRADVLAFRDFLSELMEHVKREIAFGKPRAQIVALENLPRFHPYHQTPPNRLGAALGAAYDELTGG